jgi:hypothetical protein
MKNAQKFKKRNYKGLQNKRSVHPTMFMDKKTFFQTNV